LPAKGCATWRSRCRVRPGRIEFALPPQVEADPEEAGHGPDNPDLWLLVMPANVWNPNAPRHPLLSAEATIAAETISELNTLPDGAGTGSW